MNEADQDQIERGLAQPWLDRIARAEQVFEAWQDTADNIDRQYGELERLRTVARDREFALFWSNIQVMRPSVYARPPVPVVSPRFKDRRPLYTTSSEFLERCCVVAMEMGDINAVMLSLRDDLIISGRGAGRLRYESDDDGERVCIEHTDRRDFVHEPARKWSEVGWVAFRAWLDREEMRERFGDAADDVSYETRRDEKKGVSVSSEEECGVWEVWSKTHDRVFWVTEGAERVLDEADPHLALRGFFPCPPPVYASVERRSLIPLPDMLHYKDQLEEVNSLTRRIHALSDAIRVRGFYTGGGDIGEALERAIKLTDDTQVLIPVPNMAGLVQGGGDPIIWMPLDMIASTITGLIELRRQVIDDVYQIIGLSDILRGATEADETLGAQRLKQQNGSFRVRDRQNELIRWARDAVNIAAEIMAEEFDRDSLIDMAQMDLPTGADVRKQIADAEKQSEKTARGIREQMRQAAQQGQQVDPQQAQAQIAQALQPFQQQIEKAAQRVTIDQVMEFLRDEKLRPFVLDIETDSTVYPDEMAEKSARAEFMQAFSASMSALMPMMQLGPEAVAVAGGVFKFALSPYRVGRELESLIDDFVDQGPQIAQRMQEQAKQGESEEMARANLELAKAEQRKAEAAVMQVQAGVEKTRQEITLKAAEAQEAARADQERFALEVQTSQGNIAETAARIEKIYADMQLAQQKLAIEAHREQREDVKAVADIQMRETDQAMQAQDRQRAVFESDRDAAMGARQQSVDNARADRGDRRADRQQDLAEKQAQREATQNG